MQWLINFCEDRVDIAQRLCNERSLKYGDNSWQWRWTFWQERLWDKISWWALTK